MLIPSLYACVVALIFAGTGIAGKFLSSYAVTPFTIAFFRFGIAVLLLLPFIKKTEFQNITKRTVGYIFLMGFVGIFLFNVLFFTALQYTSAISVSLISAANPMIALLVTSALIFKAPSKNQIIALLCTFIGVSLVIMHDAAPASSGLVSSNNFGEFLALVAICCQVSYALLSRHMSALFSPVFVSCLSGAAGLLFLAPFVLNGSLLMLYDRLDTTAWLAILYIGILGGAVSTTLYIHVIKKIGAPHTNMIVFSLMPIFTALLSIIIFGKAPSVWHIVGGALVLSGLYLGLRRVRV